MKIFIKVLMISFSIHICLSNLLPCNTSVNVVCSKTEKYVSANTPEPMPVNIKILLKFYDIIEVNEADQTITVTLKSVFEWQDFRLDINQSQEHINKYVESLN